MLKATYRFWVHLGKIAVVWRPLFWRHSDFIRHVPAAISQVGQV